MSEYEVIAEARIENGKGAMRRLRAGGRVPGVIYGAGKEPANISVKGNDLRKQLENEAFFSHILTVSVGGKKEQAVLKALQRNPASLDVVHVDFLRVSAKDAITMRVPLHFANEDAAPGRRAGGVFSHLMNDLEISCLPGDLPEYIEVDVAAMEVGDSLHLSQLALPEGVALTVDVSNADHDHTVVTLAMPHALDVGEEAPAGEEEEERSAEVPTVAEDQQGAAGED
jgi:large subunit ribosomal protein L25